MLYILITLTCAAALSDLLQHFFREEINYLSLNIYCTRQKYQFGLADSIRYAKGFTSDDPFVVPLVDTIYRSSLQTTVTQQLLKLYEKYNSGCLSLQVVPNKKIKDYGIVKYEKISNDIVDITGVVEKPNPDISISNLGISGA